MFKKPIRSVVLTVGVALIFTVNCASAAVYIPTARDTKMPPEKITYLETNTDGYSFITQQGNLKYYFRDDRDIFMIENVVTGANWKTGLDVPYVSEIDAALKSAVTDEEKSRLPEYKEDNLGVIYIPYANSLVSIVYYNSALNPTTLSSASEKGVKSTLGTVSDGHYRLDIDFLEIDLQLYVHIFCTDEGLTYEVYDNEIMGEGANSLESIIFTPFLGASGGKRAYYNPETGKYDIKTVNPMTPGYIFVPDGSGALIRFVDNTASLRPYIGVVYGENPAELTYSESTLTGAMEYKNPVMPVFGIAHGDKQKAFVAWADKGAEGMEIVVSPEENTTSYTYGYAKFNYNNLIYQIYNRADKGYFRLFPERSHYDVSITYKFLDNDDADYVGMALAYKEHLIEQQILTEKISGSEMPIRLDFLMSDIKKGVIGYSDVVVTTADNVSDILNELTEDGINNINSGLLGFQKGGVTSGKPWEIKPISGDFKALFTEMNGKGIDVSFSQDYVRINNLQMLLPGNQAYHKSRRGATQKIFWSDIYPVSEIAFARPSKTAEWLISQTEKAKKIGAKTMTVDGISNLLVSHTTSDINSSTSMSEAIKLYQNAFESIDMGINAVAPNSYMWKYVDRFLDTPVLTTQYIMETDTVPFLELVLAGTMELYSPYANFSFYTNEDMLRMIDYNVYPSFILTAEPAHHLSSTNSSNYYSTEYSLYKDIINDVYDTVGDILGGVMGKKWINREVLENGVIMNTYEDGTRVIINYTDNEVNYSGISVSGKSAAMSKGGAA